MRTDEAAELLRRTALFGALPADVLPRVAERTVPRRYSRGQLVFVEGDPGQSLYVVAQGLVKISVVSEVGTEMVLTTVRPPESFGEISLLDGGPRSASATALEPSLLLALTRTTLLELLRTEKELAETLFAYLGGLLRRLTEQAADLLFLDLEGRMAKLLLRLAEERGSPAGEEVNLDLGLTQSDLAAMVGGTRQSVNQVLRSFAERGYLELDGGRVVRLRPDTLARHGD